MNTKSIRKTIALGLPLLALAGSALAHRQWILPSSTSLSGTDQWISVEAAVSNDLFFPNHVAINLKSISALSPSGKELELQSPTQGKIRSSFELQLEEQGTYRISGGGKMMFASWEEDGERKRRRGSADEFAAEDLSKYEKLQLMQSISRVETIVSCGEPTDIASVGEGIELEFIDHPNDLFTGEASQFRVLLDGEPMAGQTFSILKGNDRFRDTVDEIEVTSDDQGIIEVTWPEPGRYWLNSSAELSDGVFKDLPLKRRSAYTLTVEVLPE